jgi:acyl-CoA thioester hydrolase
MAYEFKLVRRVEFSETDAAGIVHFSNFFRYMESVEHAFFRSLGHSVLMEESDPPVGWPRVAVSCEYFQPLRFEDEVELHLLVAEKKAKSLTYLIRFRKLNADPPVEVACGRLTVVCVTRDAKGRMRSVPVPKDLASLVREAPAGLLNFEQPESSVPAPAV